MTIESFIAAAARLATRGLRIATPGLLLVASACADAPPTALDAAAPAAPVRAAATVESAGTLLQCAPTAAATASRVITPAGGVLTVGGHAIAIPRGAVARPTRFTMSVPASRHIEVDITAEGVEHYQFQRPVVVTLDYSRCGEAADAVAASFTAWWIDESTRGFLADMGGVDDRFSRRLFFTTDHLSGYAVAY